MTTQQLKCTVYRSDVFTLLVVLPATLCLYVNREFEWRLIFPTPSDLLLVALDGAQQQRTGNLTFNKDQLAYSIVTDSSKEIEHLGYETRLRMLVTGGSSHWVVHNFAAPCACDFARAKELDDPEQAIIFGWPLDVYVKQLFTSASSLIISFLPNSLCADSYQVTIDAQDGTLLDYEPFVFNTFHADNEKSCGAFTTTIQQIVQVRFCYHRDLLLLTLAHFVVFLFVIVACDRYNGRIMVVHYRSVYIKHQ